MASTGRVRCQGGYGNRGHPAVFISLQRDEVCVCPYCTNFFVNVRRMQQYDTRGLSTGVDSNAALQKKFWKGKTKEEFESMYDTTVVDQKEDNIQWA